MTAKIFAHFNSVPIRLVRSIWFNCTAIRKFLELSSPRSLFYSIDMQEIGSGMMLVSLIDL